MAALGFHMWTTFANYPHAGSAQAICDNLANWLFSAKWRGILIAFK